MLQKSEGLRRTEAKAKAPRGSVTRAVVEFLKSVVTDRRGQSAAGRVLDENARRIPTGDPRRSNRQPNALMHR
jgi:hypothetical protein